MLEAIRKVWESNPDWRLGQLIVNLSRSAGMSDPFFMEDDRLVTEAGKWSAEPQREPEKENANQSAEEKLLDNGYEGVKYLTNFSYDTALVGVSHDDRAIYDYDLMVEWLVNEEGFTDEQAMEWIDYNTIRALPYMGPDSPIVLYRFPEW